MAKKTAPQGIGTINSVIEYRDLVQKIAIIIREAFELAPNTPSAINRVKTEIDSLVGRGRGNFTKTDIYQVSFSMFFSIVRRIQNENNVTFKETQVNTLVAKLMTEGQYGNPSVVRRQTTSAKLLELRDRLFPGEDLLGMTVSLLSGAQFTALTSIARTILVRGTRSTSTQRVSNRTRRTTTPTTTTPTTTPRTTTPRTTTPRTTTSRTTTPRTTTPATTATPSTGQVEAYQIQDVGNSAELLYAVRENITRFDRTNDKKIKLQTMANAFRYQLLLQIGGRDSDIILAIEDLRQSVRVVITKIGEKYNPANERAKYSTAINYLGFTLYLLCAGKINTAKKLHPSLFSRLTRADLSRKIFDLGIGNNSVTIFANFTSFVGGSSRIYDLVNKIVSASTRVTALEMRNTIGGFVGRTTGPTATVTEIDVPGFTVPRTTPASTRQVVDNNPRSTTPPESSVTTALIREIPFTGTVGLEVEYYGVPKTILEDKLTAGGVNAKRTGYTHAVTPYWKLTEDSSVGGKYEGEMVSPILRGKAGLVEMRKCINLCQEAGMLVNRTGGMHVHFGMQGVSVQSIVNIIVNYNNLQPIIDKMLHKWRRGTQWGKPFNAEQISRIKRATTMNDIYNAVVDQNRSWTQEDNRHQGRYHSINVFCYLAYGTIEFRQYTSVLEPDTTLMWVYFLHFLIEVSKKRQLTRFDWTNVENFLPKKVATFWANRIYELGDGNDSIVTDYTSRETR